MDGWITVKKKAKKIENEYNEKSNFQKVPPGLPNPYASALNNVDGSKNARYKIKTPQRKPGESISYREEHFSKKSERVSPAASNIPNNSKDKKFKDESAGLGSNSKIVLKKFPDKEKCTNNFSIENITKARKQSNLFQHNSSNLNNSKGYHIPLSEHKSASLDVKSISFLPKGNARNAFKSSASNKTTSFNSKECLPPSNNNSKSQSLEEQISFSSNNELNSQANRKNKNFLRKQKLKDEKRIQKEQKQRLLNEQKKRNTKLSVISSDLIDNYKSNNVTSKPVNNFDVANSNRIKISENQNLQFALKKKQSSKLSGGTYKENSSRRAWAPLNQSEGRTFTTNVDFHHNDPVIPEVNSVEKVGTTSKNVKSSNPITVDLSELINVCITKTFILTIFASIHSLSKGNSYLLLKYMVYIFLSV